MSNHTHLKRTSRSKLFLKNILRRRVTGEIWYSGETENVTILPFVLVVVPVQSEKAPIVRFGVFEADLRAGELRKNGIKVKIQDLPFRALTLLVSCPDRVLSREEFRKALWAGDVYVDFDHGISSAINRLRETLDDTASSPRFIETVARAGYRWIAPVRVVAATPGESVAELGAGDQSNPENPPAAPVQARRSSKQAWAVAAVSAVLIAGSTGAWIWRRSSAFSLKSSPAAAAASPHVPSPQAEELYLKGRYYWAKRTPEDLHQAVDYFTQAIVRDPNYAKAYVGLADTYILLREFAAMPESEAYDRAFAAASKGAELDKSSAEVHATLGFIYFWSKRDVTDANREFERAIALDPNYANAHHWYGNVLMNQGRTAEGLTHLTRAEELDPSSPSIRADKGLALVTADRPDEGIAMLRQMEATDASFLSPHAYLAGIYLARMECPEYLTEARAQARLSGNPDKLAIVRAAEKDRGAGGCSGMLQRIFQEQTKLYSQQRITAYELAETQALLGNKAEALKYLRLSLAQSDGALVSARTDIQLRSLHQEPGFRRLIVDAGLPPLQ